VDQPSSLSNNGMSDREDRAKDEKDESQDEESEQI
jgi:hypothetical protein